VQPDFQRLNMKHC